MEQANVVPRQLKTPHRHTHTRSVAVYQRKELNSSTGFVVVVVVVSAESISFLSKLLDEFLCAFENGRKIKEIFKFEK